GCDVFVKGRRRHTRCLSDWSSDVCSSDLFRCIELLEPVAVDGGAIAIQLGNIRVKEIVAELHSRQLSLIKLSMPVTLDVQISRRSEERRVGKESSLLSTLYSSEENQ